MMKNTALNPGKDASDIAVQALTFLASEENRLFRFLDITGWSPATLSSSDSRAAILVSALEYLMSDEDILLTFSANSSIDPGEIIKAHAALQNGETPM